MRASTARRRCADANVFVFTSSSSRGSRIALVDVVGLRESRRARRRVRYWLYYYLHSEHRTHTLGSRPGLCSPRNAKTTHHRFRHQAPHEYESAKRVPGVFLQTTPGGGAKAEPGTLVVKFAVQSRMVSRYCVCPRLSTLWWLTCDWISSCGGAVVFSTSQVNSWTRGGAPGMGVVL